MSERDDFDKIVEGLDLDLSFPDEPADPMPDPDDLRAQVQEAMSSFAPAEPAETQEPFYRQVEPTSLVPKSQGTRLAWLGVLGSPLVLVLAALAHVFLDRALFAGAALIFVASAIYLFLQLPEHGPSHRDWPDDGAVL